MAQYELPQSTLDAKLKGLRRSIDETLAEFLGEQRQALEKIDARTAVMIEDISALIGAGGKRIRPIFCYWGHLAAGGGASLAIIRAAASLELLHTMALIHDDVMDRSVTRRGEPTLFRRAAKRRPGAPRDAEHFGVSIALLVGDLAFTLSDHLLATSGFPPAALTAASVPLNEMRLRALAGQFLDLHLSGHGAPDVDTAAQIARLKTASYTVEGPLVLGAALALRADEQVRESLAHYGRDLGEAYQLQDDLLGLFGDPVQTGKGAAADLAEGKATVLIAQALRLASVEDREVILGIWGRRDASPLDEDALREAIRRSGALQVLQRSIRDLVSRAKHALTDFASGRLQSEAVTVLNGLADLVVEPS